MQKAPFRVGNKGLCGLVVCLVVVGCGGASQSESSADSRYAGDSTSENVALVDTPKVIEAAKRCEQERKDAELQPPDALAPIQVHACIYAKRTTVDGCHKGPERKITLKIIVEKDGTVSNVFPIGDTADSPEAKCVAEVVKTIAFPRFKGQMQQVLKYPFTVGN